jgi:Tol biopolymer transport system component
VTPERWRQIETLFHAAKARPARERVDFVRAACAGDEELRRDVESLLAAPPAGDEFLEEPAIAVAARIAGKRPGPALIGRRIGVYQVSELLGVGGMGEVYRARDTRLGRDVAIKILPPSLTADPGRLARFEREARLLASLNHPRIGAIYGVEESDGLPALVLELVEGATLADLIARGPLPLKDALPITRQIAAALDAAHERGIVHRDLKPANIKITSEGVVKVLDFGLAKTAARDDPAGQPPVVTVDATREGVILGTTFYMSPEQARGQAVDKRTDIWAFGCVLYEMLTGHKALAGATMSDTIAAILEREPDWTRLPAAVPPAIVRLLHRCLEKDPKRRLRDIADAAIELDDAQPGAGRIHRAAGAAGAAGAGDARRRSLVRWLLAATAMAAISVAATLAVTRLRRTPDPVGARLSISAPGQITAQSGPAVSPDGRRVAFVSTDVDGQSMLWIRALDSLEPRVVPGTENAAHPFWSPDGASLGFIAAGKLKRVDAASGNVQTLANVSVRVGGAWNRDNVILFSPEIDRLATVPASGGPVSYLTASGMWPSFLPDGRHFLHTRLKPDRKGRDVFVGSLDSPETKQLITSNFKAWYAAPGYLLFMRNDTLMAQAFDADRLELRGEPFVVAQGVWNASAAAQASFSVSPTGVLAYMNSTVSNTQVLAFDRKGRMTGPMTPSALSFDVMPQLSPSGRQLLIARGEPQTGWSMWLYDLAGGTNSRFTVGAGSSALSAWSSDGSRVVFQSDLGPGLGSTLTMKRVDGTGPEERLLKSGPAEAIYLWDWSADGRFIVYGVSSPDTKGIADLSILPLDGDRKPHPFLQSSFNKEQAQISPDGKWIAYTSYESGKDEVYVQSFPTPGGKRQISVDGGVQPRWRRDGSELFYVTTRQVLTAVPVKKGVTFDIGPPEPLFRTKILPHGSQSMWFSTFYDVTADGQRFAINGPPEDPTPPITVVLNWPAASGRP